MSESIDVFSREVAGLPMARPHETVTIADGESYDLTIAPVAKQLGPATVRMLAYNGSIPGPTLRLQQGSEIVVNVVNEGDGDATVHWHGLRLENRFDGTHETQAPIPVGGRFSYRVQVPDPGVYWYHPHIREDYNQELGLYGNFLVVPSEPDYWPPVDRELTVVLDDILIENGEIAPFRRDTTTYAAMGRFGNVLLANGEVDPALSAKRGEVVRLYFTNTANTRVFNVGLPGARLKRVGGDSGHYETEELVERVILAPSERVVVDALFEQAGELALEHRTPGKTYGLARIEVEESATTSAAAAEFGVLRTNADMTIERERLEADLARDPDKTVALVAEMAMGEPDVAPGGSIAYVCPMHPEVVSDEPGRCPKCQMTLLPAELVAGAAAGAPAHDHSAVEHSREPDGIEWEDDMVDVNRMTTPANFRWSIVDRETNASGGGIDWRFRVGDRIKLRVVNEMDSDHPMHHPFHIHGAGRFLIMARDGVTEPNLVWKDTVLIPTGQVVDLLLDVTNPGRWMAHCHIAEHHESGMMFSFDVEP